MTCPHVVQDSDASTMQFIDFEYARWSHRGFDLGNHFNEYAGFECDYTRYPEKEHIAFFMQHYLAEGEANEPVSLAQTPSGIAKLPAIKLTTVRMASVLHIKVCELGDCKHGAAACPALHCLALNMQDSYMPCPVAQEEAQVQKAVIEANVFALASHQFWGSWALLQAKFSPIEFDYMEYSNLRWSEYLRRKEEFLADVDNFCSKHC